MSGPDPGDRGRRVTVLHPNQPAQCSHCLKYPHPSSSPTPSSNHCQGGGNGKICKDLLTDRTSMTSYIKSLKDEGYTSLRDKHYNKLKSFPALGKVPPIITLNPDVTDRENQADNDDDDEGGEVEKTTATNGTKEPQVAGVSPSKLQQDEKTQKTSTKPPSQQEKHTGTSMTSSETDPITENPDNLPDKPTGEQTVHDNHPTPPIDSSEPPTETLHNLAKTTPNDQADQDDQTKAQTKDDPTNNRAPESRMKLPQIQVNKSKEEPILLVNHPTDPINTSKLKVKNSYVTVSGIRAPSSKSPRTPASPSQVFFGPLPPSRSPSPS